MDVLWVVTVMCLGVASSSSVSLPPVLDITLLESSQPGCQADIQALRKGIASGQLWAQTIVDAGARSPPAGLLSGTGVQFGDFDLCLTVSSPVTAQFCMMDVSPGQKNHTTWSQFKWGVCVPASCSPQELQISMQTYMDRHSEGLRVTVMPGLCTTKENSSRRMSELDIAFCMLVACLLLVVIVATVHDLMSTSDFNESSPPKSLCQCLSARFAVLSLFRAENPIPGVNLRPIYCFHACSIAFIVFGHHYGMPLVFSSLINYRFIVNMFTGPWTSSIMDHFELPVDVFFFLSSFLMALLYYAELHKHYVSPVMLYINRVIRILPSYALVIMFYSTVMYHFGDGPFWNTVMNEEQGFCQSSWWTNMIFLNNYINFEKLCMLQSWYVACDLHLFICGSLIVLLYFRNEMVGALVIGVAFLASTMVPFVVSYVYEIPAFLIFYKEMWVGSRSQDSFRVLNSQSQYRGTSYLPGLLTGLYVYKNRHSHLSKSGTHILQAVGIVICMAVLWSGSLFYRLVRPSRFMNALYAASFRTVFGVGMAFVTVSCVIGHPSLLTSVTSWTGFVPLSKLSYGVFLVHMIPQLIWLAESRTNTYVNITAVCSWMLIDLVYSLIMAFILNVTVESPVRYLVKRLITGSHSSKDPSKKL